MQSGSGSLLLIDSPSFSRRWLSMRLVRVALAQGAQGAVDALGWRWDFGGEMWSSFCSGNIISCLCCKASPCPRLLVWRHRRRETSDAVAIFPSLESRLGEDTERPQGSEVVAREALTGGESLDPASLHSAAVGYGQGTLYRWLVGTCHPALSSPAASAPHAADFCLLGCERNTGDFGSSTESSWGFWHPGSY